MSSAFTLDGAADRRTDHPPRTGVAVAAPVPLGRALRWAAIIGAGLSTQYLAQPFVWRQWPVDLVLLGWLEVLRDEIVVAAWLALSVCIATRARAKRLPVQAAVMAVALAAGAWLGEATLRSFDPELTRPGSPVGRVMQSTLLALCACGIWALWRRADAMDAAAQAALRDQTRTAAAIAEAKLLALRQQIEPHFLFNTLATIARFSEAGEERALRLLQHLETYLAASLRTQAMTTTLAEELDLVESYLSIVAVRMSGRLAWSIDAPSVAREQPCPALAVATLVENAVKHGITPLPGTARIDVSARLAEGRVDVIVADTGVGMLGSQAPIAGSGLGLANTRARLAALYEGRATLDLRANAPSGVRAMIHWPASST